MSLKVLHMVTIFLLVVLLAVTTGRREATAKFDAATDFKEVTIDHLHFMHAILLKLMRDQNWRGILPTLLRLSFHECADSRKCDACLDIVNEPFHGGLARAIKFLEFIYESEDHTARDGVKWCDIMSRADFYVLMAQLSGLISIERQYMTNGGQPVYVPKIQWLYGREDCSAAPVPLTATDTEINIGTQEKVNFPSPMDGSKDIFGFMREIYGFEAEEGEELVVATMGSHSLGRARHVNTGFYHAWVKRPDVMDNAWAVDMLDNSFEWEQEFRRKNKTFQFRHGIADSDLSGGKRFNGGFRGLMLNVDFALAYDIEPEENGKVECTIGESTAEIGNKVCLPRDNTFTVVEKFARNNKYFLDKWAEGMNVIWTNGYADEELMEIGTYPQCGWKGAACQNFADCCSGNCLTEKLLCGSAPRIV